MYTQDEEAVPKCQLDNLLLSYRDTTSYKKFLFLKSPPDQFQLDLPGTMLVAFAEGSLDLQVMFLRFWDP